MFPRGLAGSLRSFADSKSINRTFFLNVPAKISATATVVVVFATPPLRLMNEITLTIGSFLRRSHART